MYPELDDFSNKVTSQIRELLPEWVHLGEVQEYEGEKAYSLTVYSPSKGIEALIIDTFRQEVTVSFGSNHTHFDEFIDKDNGGAYSLIKDIVNEIQVSVSYWRDQKWCGSMFVYKDFIPVDNEQHPYANKVKVRSWYGNYDNDIESNPID